MIQPANDTTGVYVNLAELISLQSQATGFSFLPGQRLHSLLSGRHGSRLRGRGLDFKELRQYLPGDDIRSIDWKATRRTGHPYVRVYSEEKERPVLLLVDQRLSMFFGSAVNMKSVTAAHTATLAAWRVLASGDRIGAIIFNDTRMLQTRPQRSRRCVLQLLHNLVLQNRQLGIDRTIQAAPRMLNQVLQQTAHQKYHDYLIAVISDFSGMNNETLHWSSQLNRHNDLILLPVFDPLARKLPAKARLVVSNGHQQIHLDAQDARLKRRFPAFLEGRLNYLSETLSHTGVPVLPVDTVQPVIQQIRRNLGQFPGIQKRQRVS